MPAIGVAVAAAAVSISTASALTGATILGITLTAGMATFVGAIAGLVVSMGLSLLIPRPKPRASDTAADRFNTFRSGIAPRAVVYGQALVTGPAVYMGSFGTYNEFIYVVVPVAAHAIQGYDYIWLNSYRIPVAHVSAGSSGTTGGGAGGVQGLYTVANAMITKGTGDSTISTANVLADPSAPTPTDNADAQIQLRLYDGTQVAADTDIITHIPADWTTDHKLLGVAYIVARVRYSRDIFPSGIQTVAAEIRGKVDVLDVRTSTRGYTNNAALCILDYLQAGVGLGVPDAEIETAFWQAAANICDENVTIDGIGTTQKRYTLDGSFKLDTTPVDIMDQLLTSCAGTLTFVSGLYRLHVGAYDSPTVTLGPGDFAGPIKVTTGWPRAQQVNTIQGTYIEPAQNYAAIAFPQVQDSAFVTADGEEVDLSVNFPFTIDANRVQRLAALRLLVHRVAGLRVDATFKYGTLRMAVWDVVALTHADFGWTSQPFRVVRWSFDPDQGLVTATLQAEDSAAYAWTYSSASPPVLSPTTTLSSPLTLPTLSAPSVTGGTVTNADGTVTPSLAVTWTQGASPYLTGTEVNWKLSSDSTWQTISIDMPALAMTILPVKPGASYDVRIRAIAMLVRGAWSSTTTVSAAGKTTAPANPTGVSVAPIVGGYSVAWTKPADRDLAAVEVWEQISPYGSVAYYVGETSGAGFVYATPAGDYSARHVYVIARNTSNIYAGAPTFVTAGTVTPALTATGDIQANAVTAFGSTASTTPQHCSTSGWEDALSLTVSTNAGDAVLLLFQAALDLWDDGTGAITGGSGGSENGTSNG